MATKRTPSIKRFLAAIESGDIKRVQRFLARGANVHGEHWHETPSSCAIRCGHMHILALLLRHGLDPRRCEDGTISHAAVCKRQDMLKLLCTAVFAPDLWRGKTRAEIEKEAHLIYHNIDRDLGMNFPDLMEEELRLARLELFDAAMTCWEHVRPDPPKLNISRIPAKGTAL